jgi:DNA-directed RNA polymerase specialized sigma24 family protein
MDDHDLLEQRFEAHRTHLRVVVAYWMLGSLSEADDAVQEAWLQLSRCDTSGVANLGGWLTTIVARVCLDMLRSPSGSPSCYTTCSPYPSTRSYLGMKRGFDPCCQDRADGP